MAEKTRLNINIPLTISDKLDAVSDELGISKTALVITALNQFFQGRDSINTISQLQSLVSRSEAMTSKAIPSLSQLVFDFSSQRYSVDGRPLHAGDPVTVVRADGSRVQSSIEHDEHGWYLVGWPDRSLEGLSVMA